MFYQMPKYLENTIIVFCDGACSGNPGPGGWGAIVASSDDGFVLELGGGSRETTNNQMEMMAALKSLQEVGRLAKQGTKVLIYTDSAYLIRGITQWIWGWKNNGWVSAEGREVSNQDLWKELLRTVTPLKKTAKVDWKFVKGHSGVPANERCDEIAVSFSQGRRPTLFSGNLLNYDVPVFDLPPDRPLPDMRARSEEKEKAYSYLSEVGGIVIRHSTWAECERRVKGVSGARFKKSKSQTDELEILSSWGVDPSLVR